MTTTFGRHCGVREEPAWTCAEIPSNENNLWRFWPNSDTWSLLREPVQEHIHLGRRPQVMNALVLASRRYKLSVLGRQTAVTQPEHTIAVDRATEYWTALRPPFRVYKEALRQALRHPQEVHEQRQIDVDKRVRAGETLPSRLDAAKAINNPCVTLQQLRVRLQIFVVRNFAATGSVLNRVQGVERNVRQLRQPLGEGRLAATSVSEDSDLFHGTLFKAPNRY